MLLHWSEHYVVQLVTLRGLYSLRSSSSHLPPPSSIGSLLFFCFLLSFLYQARASIFSQSMNSAPFCHCSYNCCLLHDRCLSRYLFPLTISFDRNSLRCLLCLWLNHAVIKIDIYYRYKYWQVPTVYSQAKIKRNIASCFNSFNSITTYTDNFAKKIILFYFINLLCEQKLFNSSCDIVFREIAIITANFFFFPRKSSLRIYIIFRGIVISLSFAIFHWKAASWG